METSQQSKEMTPKERRLANLRPPFKPGQSGNPKGRPKSRVSEQLAKVMGKAQAKKIFKLNNLELEEWDAILLTLTVNQLKLLAQWDEASAYPKGLAISILYDMKNRTTKTIDKLRDRVRERLTQRIEITGRDGKDLITDPIMIEIIDSRDKVDAKDTDN